jgi:hypothetical protein
MKRVGGAANFVARPLTEGAKAALKRLDEKLDAIVLKAEKAAEARHADLSPRPEGRLFWDAALEQSYHDYLNKRRGG